MATAQVTGAPTVGPQIVPFCRVDPECHQCSLRSELEAVGKTRRVIKDSSFKSVFPDGNAKENLRAGRRVGAQHLEAAITVSLQERGHAESWLSHSTQTELWPSPEATWS